MKLEKKIIKKVVQIVILCILIIVVITLPIIIGDYGESSFLWDVYNALVPAIIAGIISIYCVNWQFQQEREKVHEEKVVGARCFFKVNYLNESENINTINLYKCSTNSKDNDMYANFYLMLQLKTVAYIYDCKINIEVGSESIHTNLGIVVTGQYIVVPVFTDESKKIKVEIRYMTQMNEKLVHELFFEDFTTFKATERVFYYKYNKKIELLKCESQIFIWDNIGE